MSAWFLMPRGDSAQRGAATASLRDSLCAIRCASMLLVLGAMADRDRALGVAMLRELKSAEEALNRLSLAGTDPSVN
jgi:hypothetical protein